MKYKVFVDDKGEILSSAMNTDSVSITPDFGVAQDIDQETFEKIRHKPKDFTYDRKHRTLKPKRNKK